MQAIREQTQNIIEDWIQPRSKVLDLGCGDGALLSRLTEKKHIEGTGVEISQEMIVKCLGRGISVYQADIDRGLSQWDDLSFDYVILTATLQVIHRPYRVISEMLRVGHYAVISLSNFGYIANRISIMHNGSMSGKMRLSGHWHDTPVIRFVCLNEFMRSLDEMDIKILDARYFFPMGITRNTGAPLGNIFVKEALFMLGHQE